VLADEICILNGICPIINIMLSRAQRFTKKKEKANAASFIGATIKIFFGRRKDYEGILRRYADQSFFVLPKDLSDNRS
jgi:hypothetical protein